MAGIEQIAERELAEACLSAHSGYITGPESRDRIYTTLTDSTLKFCIQISPNYTLIRNKYYFYCIHMTGEKYADTWKVHSK